MALSGCLLICLDEIDQYKSSQMAQLKQALSKVKVNGRRIYGRTIDERHRYASFIATTNNPHPLSDVTGSRRNICIKIADGYLIDNDTDIEYDQLFAQLKHEILVEKKTKRGSATIDLKAQAQVKLTQTLGDGLYLDLRMPAGTSVNVNPSLLIDAFRAYLQEKAENVQAGMLHAERLAILCADGTDFR